jgi:hypothetical protein
MILDERERNELERELERLQANARSVQADISSKESLLSAAEQRDDEGHAEGLRNEIQNTQSRLDDFEDDIAKIERAL